MADRAQQPDRSHAHRETLEILGDMAELLDVGLSRSVLAYCVVLIENGVSPEALATVLKELRSRYPEEETS